VLSEDFMRVYESRRKINGKVFFIVLDKKEQILLESSMKRLFENNWPIYAKLIKVDPDSGQLS